MLSLNQLPLHIQTPIRKTQEAQRLFHGRGHAFDGLYHVTVDWLPPVALITLFASESSQSIEKLADQLLQILPECKSIQLQHRYELHGPIDVIHGDAIEQLVVEENGLKYQLQLGKSRNTGLFLDMSNGREWVQTHSQGKRVLNLFAYTCGFSVAAIAGEAKSVLNIDMSSAALNVGRENHRLNKHSLGDVKFEKLNIFKSFGRLKKRGPFDLLICDPPTLQKGSVDIARDYPKIMRRLDEFMAPNATLVLCLNAPELGRDFLIDNMARLAPQYRFVTDIKPPEVYIDAENKGLKVLVFTEFIEAHPPTFT
ncbi:MAG: class I SAM-dependent methyltransferase [Cocleimonas sp.]|nr:class I SAM-dependent methyltransferase [Cocleimonas sp.]